MVVAASTNSSIHPYIHPPTDRPTDRPTNRCEHLLYRPSVSWPRTTEASERRKGKREGVCRRCSATKTTTTIRRSTTKSVPVGRSVATDTRPLTMTITIVCCRSTTKKHKTKEATKRKILVVVVVVVVIVGANSRGAPRGTPPPASVRPWHRATPRWRRPSRPVVFFCRRPRASWVSRPPTVLSCRRASGPFGRRTPFSKPVSFPASRRPSGSPR